MGVVRLAFICIASLLANPASGQELEATTGTTPVDDGGYVGSVDVTGWEGFFPPAMIDEAWLEQQSLPFDATVVQSTIGRVGKVIIDDGERHAPSDALELMHQRYCTDPTTRSWNEDRCSALEQRVCDGVICTYRHIGNCSGFVYDRSVFLTAAHCVDGMLDHPKRRSGSAILLPGPEGPVRHAVGDVRVGKTDFDHQWVALDDADPVDVAAVTIDAGGAVVTYPTAPLPQPGQPLFIAGYPRVEGRDQAALDAAGYALNFGTTSVSFGRLADRNDAQRPLCNVDGWQEHWALAEPCPSGKTMVEGYEAIIGVITRFPFLATFDSSNGYSGAPVFDVRGGLVGINVTLISETNPQEAFDPAARMVAVPILRALSRLSIGDTSGGEGP